MALICISFWFASFLRSCVLLKDRAHPAPPRHCLYTLFIYFLIVTWKQRNLFMPRPLSLSLYVRHIRHSSPAEFDSITAQTSSHYLSAEHSLNVNVFLGRLHQCEILKNIPLIDNMNHQACVPSPLNTPFTILRGNMMKNCLHAITCSREIGLRCRFSDQPGFSTRIRTLVIGLIRANSCVGHASVMTYINTEQTCSLKNEVPHPSRR